MSAAAVGTMGFAVLVGWFAGIDPLTTLVPGYPAMMPNTALALVVLAIAVAALEHGPIASVLGGAVAALSGLTLAEYVFGRPFGIDLLLPGIDIDHYAARMSPVTAVSLLLLGVGVLVRSSRVRLMNGLALSSMCLGYIAVLGYAYSSSPLYTVGGYTSMALHTSLSLVVLSIALVLAKPSAELADRLWDGGSAGTMLRRAMPLVICGPLMLGWLGLWAQHRGWFDTNFGVAVLVLSMSVLGLALSWLLASGLREIDRQRERIADALVEANRTLAATVLYRTDELERTVEVLKTLVRSAPVGILVFDQFGTLLAANERWLELSGLTHEESRHAGWLEAAHRDDQERVRSEWRAGIDAGLPYETDLCLVTPQGRISWVQLTRAPVSTSGVLTGHVASVTDVTAVHVAREESLALTESAERAIAFYDALLAAFPDSVFVTDVATGAVTYWSRDDDIVGMTPDEMRALGPNVNDLVHPEDRSRLQAENLAAANLAQGEVRSLVYRAKPPDGAWHWLSRRLTPFRRDASGAVIEVLGLSRNLSGAARQDETLIREARYDGLTGLPNRAHAIDRVEVALSRAGHENGEIGVLFCRLDGLADLMNGAGRASAEEILLDTARRLHNVLLTRPEDTVARVGFDAFVVVVEPWNAVRADGHQPRRSRDRSVVTGIADQVAAALRQTVTVDGIEHLLTVSVGVAFATGVPVGGSGPVAASDALRDAEEARSSPVRSR
ncbi:PAS domain-containing protein [Pengzhenrongella sp.]|uniref:PAS domain-containing protein n=1 Tax=Pengzhenrongella sp. TaxID=2888820 RepID=UPI002F924E90